MKLSYQWLRKWVVTKLDARILAERLTLAGLEVSALEPVASLPASVVVAKIRALKSHPGAANLKICDVEVQRDRRVQVVCGAPNVARGMKVPLALPGAVLPGGRRVETATIHGVESAGMLCSAAELGWETESAGILVLDADARVGKSVTDALELDDTVLHIDLTPNRGDCLSVRGIAREVAAITGTRVVSAPTSTTRVRARERVMVKVAAKKACPRYAGRVIRKLRTDATAPLWMRERLRRAGVRSLHPVVDVTNYVMLELGQPMHAFDLSRLRGAIRVHTAVGTETLTLLDGRELAAPAGSLLIADDRGAIALAGIMGGEETAVGAETSAVFFESAFFSPDAIAPHARALGIQTESSQRFERGVDPELQVQALERATALLLGIAGGEAGPITDVVSRRRRPRPIALRADRLARVVGCTMPPSNVERALKALAMDTVSVKNGWRVTPPSYRFDLNIEEDLIEEVVRVTGYQNVPAKLPFTELKPPDVPESQLAPSRLRSVLVDRDYQEVITYSFVDPTLEHLIDPAASVLLLANPISADMGAMRTTLWPGLLRTLQYNLNRQQQRIRIFEIGRRFTDTDSPWFEQAVIAGAVCGPADHEQWGLSARPTDFYDVKGDIESLFLATGAPENFRFVTGRHPALHAGQTAAIHGGGGQIGWVGALDPGLRARLELGETVLFEIDLSAVTKSRLPTVQDVSRFPAIRRDLAIVVSEQIAAASILDAVKKVAGKLLVNLQLFDVYRGEGIDSGRKSLALGLTLQDSSRTLKEAEVDSLMAQIVSTLAEEVGGELRR